MRAMISARIVPILAKVGMGASMTSILILIALSALSGFVAGNHFSWPALVATVLTPLAAVVLQCEGFAALPGISIVFACLTTNQLAYLIAIRLKNDPNEWGTEDLKSGEFSFLFSRS